MTVKPIWLICPVEGGDCNYQWACLRLSRALAGSLLRHHWLCERVFDGGGGLKLYRLSFYESSLAYGADFNGRPDGRVAWGWYAAPDDPRLRGADGPDGSPVDDPRVRLVQEGFVWSARPRLLPGNNDLFTPVLYLSQLERYLDGEDNAFQRLDSKTQNLTGR